MVTKRPCSGWPHSSKPRGPGAIASRPSLSPYEKGCGPAGDYLAVLERSLGVEMHERTRPGGKRRATAWHCGRLYGFEQLAVGRPMLTGPPQVGQHPLLADTAKGQDADNDHFPILDRQCLALPDREFREGDAGPG